MFALLRVGLVVNFIAQIILQRVLQAVAQLEGPDLQNSDEDLVLALVIILEHGAVQLLHGTDKHS